MTGKEKIPVVGLPFLTESSEDIYSSVLDTDKFVPIVVAVILNETGFVYTQRRPLDKPFPGMWELPGGKVQRGETLEQALRREIKEEMEVTVEPASYLTTFFEGRLQNENNKLYVFHYFHCRIWDVTVEQVRLHAATECRWMRCATAREWLQQEQLLVGDRAVMAALQAGGLRL